MMATIPNPEKLTHVLNVVSEWVHRTKLAAFLLKMAKKQRSTAFARSGAGSGQSLREGVMNS